MSNRLPKIETLEQAVKIYGSLRVMAKAFNVSVRKTDLNNIHAWFGRAGVPSHQHLGLYLGLLARGRTASPRLFGLNSWQELPGIGEA